MASEQVPVTPELVRWARERAGYSLEEAAAVFAKIAAWEAGEAAPTYPQLESLAATFKLPIAVFFFPGPPDLPAIEETFRTLPASQLDEMPRQIRFLLRKAKAFQINLDELCQGTNPAARLITDDIGFRPSQNPGEMAEVVREYIGVSIDDQVAWATDDDALKGWRAAIQRVGIFTFKDAFQADEYSGFCLFDKVFPIIYVNNSNAKTRQIFTLFHELAHLLFQTSGIDTLGDEYIGDLPTIPRRIEILCNRFAASFLLPDAIVVEATKDTGPNEATAEALAAKYHVSRELVFRKFLDREFIDEATYTSAAARWASQKKKGNGGNYYWTKISYLGRDYIELAFRQYYQNRIDQRQLAEYLDSKPRNLGAIEEYVARGGE